MKKEKDVKTTEEESIKDKVKKAKEAKKPEVDVEKLNEEILHWKNEYYKAYADMSNLRKNMEKEQIEIYKYRIEGFVEKLLGVLDAFDFAFKIEPSNPETKNYLTGFQYVHNQLLSVLENEGIQMIVPKVGDKFDEKTMQAVDLVEDEGETNTIKDVTLKGYKLHDHLIRPSMVIVTKKKEEKTEEESDEIKN